jgi:hypothetical protein
VDLLLDGSLGRNTFRAQGVATVDLVLTKRFAISERQNLQFRAEAFNLMNRTHFGIPVLVDGAQSVPHLAVDVRELDCEFYAFSSHKIYGPSGVGVLYGKKALLVYSAPSPGLMTPSGGYVFEWAGMYGGSFGQRISSFRMDNLKSTRIEIEACFDMKLVSADLGFFFDSITA